MKRLVPLVAAALLSATCAAPDVARLTEIRSVFAQWRVALASRRSAFELAASGRAAAAVSAELEALHDDLTFALGRFDALAKCVGEIIEAPCFRLGDLLLSQVARIKKRPASALYLQRIECQIIYFEQWRVLCERSALDARKALLNHSA